MVIRAGVQSKVKAHLLRKTQICSGTLITKSPMGNREIYLEERGREVMDRIPACMILIKCTGADQRKLFSSSCFKKANSAPLLGASATSHLVAADSSLQPLGSAAPCPEAARAWGPPGVLPIPFPWVERAEMQTDPLLFGITPSYKLVTINYKNKGRGCIT